MNDPFVKPYATFTDRQLLQLISAHDTVAFATLYDRHAVMVYSLLLRVVRDPKTAEDLLQESFWQVWQKADQYAGTGTVGAWLLRIARNKAFDELRHQRCRPQFQEFQEFQEVEERGAFWPTGQSSSLEQQLLQQCTEQAISQALATIPTEQRRCLQLAFFEGLSHNAIAELTNTPLGTIKTRLRCGLAKVEHLLRGMGYQASYG